MCCHFNQVEAWDQAAVDLSHVPVGTPICVNGTLRKDLRMGPPRLKVVVDTFWGIVPATIPAFAEAHVNVSGEQAT